jgi:hypothetical protein
MICGHTHTLILAVADTIHGLPNRYLTNINTRYLTYRSEINSAESYNLLQ